MRTRRASKTAPGSQPHWVAVAIAGGRKDGAAEERGWFESCYAVDVSLPVGGGGGDKSGWIGGGGNDKGDNEAAGREGAEIEALLQRSLPGARLRRLVRLQDRGRWLRFARERDGAASSAIAAAAATAREDETAVNAGITSRQASVLRLFADPRDVVVRETLRAIAAPMAPAGGGGMPDGRTVAGTLALDEDAVDDRLAGGRLSSATAAGDVRCADTARFAAVAFAPPPAQAGGEGEWDCPEEDSNMRTLAIVKAVTGVSVEPGGRSARVGSGSVVLGDLAPDARVTAVAAGVARPEFSSADREQEDPFCGVEPSIDDFTRVGGIALSSSAAAAAGARAVDGSSGSCAAADGLDANPGTGGRAMLKAASGLSLPAVHSIKNWESLRGRVEEGEEEAGGEQGRIGLCDGSTAAVYTVRRDACYPEYLATFSFPPHAT